MHCGGTFLGILALCCVAAGVPQYGRAQSRQPLSRRAIDSIVNPRVTAQEALYFERSEVRLDSLSEDDAPVTVEFPFVNRTEEPVVVTRVVTTCGCTTAEYDRRPVPPGGSGRIRITFDPAGHPGALLRKTFVYTNRSQTAPAARLVLVGSVRPSTDPWRDYPYAAGALRLRRRSVTFRGMDRMTRSAEVIACANGGREPLRPEVGELPPYLTFRVDPQPIAPEAEADLIFLFDGRALPPETTDTLRVSARLIGEEIPDDERMIQITITLK